MRKTVVFAEDSKEALEIIARELGPTALILETRRVKDGVEVVAGITDVPSASAQRENFNRVLNEVRTNQTFLNKGPELAPTKPAAPAAGQAPSAAAPDRLNHILQRLDCNAIKRFLRRIGQRWLTSRTLHHRLNTVPIAQ